MSCLYIGNDKYEFDDGLSLLQIIQSCNLSIESPCSGMGFCGKCKVKIVSGDINPLTDDEINLLTQRERSNNIRLSCYVYPLGDIKVELLFETNNKSKILSEGYMPKFEINPIITKKVFKIVKPTLENNVSYEDIIKSIIPMDFDYEQIKTLPNIFKEDEFTAVFIDKKIIGIEPKNAKDDIYCIGVDIGSTTVVASLIDVNKGIKVSSESAINPQTKYGLDVLSRINYTSDNKDGLDVLSNIIRKCINDLIKNLCHSNKIKKESIYEINIAANTTMMHLLVGIDPISIGKSPYVPTFVESKNLMASSLDIKISPFGRVYLMPGVSSYIGADIVSGVCVCKMDKTRQNILFIDIGTNGEIVLSKSGKLVSCSCAAGPALEGMNISCGMRAGYGAIEEIKIGDKIEFKVIGDTNPQGICGSGIIDIISELVRLKIIGKTGRIAKREDILKDEKLSHLANHIVDDNKKRRFVIARLCDKEIYITQDDIRQVQLAKGAILSGFYALLENMNMQIEHIDEVIIAGQFGKHLSIESLVGVGILPNELNTKITYVGNSSKSGAIMSILSKDTRYEAQRLAKTIDYFELSTKDGYERLFMDCLKFN